MKPGRELDALVAEKVMGIRLYMHESYFGPKLEKHGPYVEPQDGGSSILNPPKPYSIDIAAAWTVVEKMISYSERHLVIEKTGAWLVRFRQEDGWTPGETCPHAICLAALKICGVDINSIQAAGAAQKPGEGAKDGASKHRG